MQMAVGGTIPWWSGAFLAQTDNKREKNQMLPLGAYIYQLSSGDIASGRILAPFFVSLANVAVLIGKSSQDKPTLSNAASDDKSRLQGDMACWLGTSLKAAHSWGLELT